MLHKCQRWPFNISYILKLLNKFFRFLIWISLLFQVSLDFFLFVCGAGCFDQCCIGLAGLKLKVHASVSECWEL